jgi:hypothetical protein
VVAVSLKKSLTSEPFVVLGVLPPDASPFELTAPDGGVLEVRLTLSTRYYDGAPRVERVGVEWGCPGPD